MNTCTPYHQSLPDIPTHLALLKRGKFTKDATAEIISAYNAEGQALIKLVALGESNAGLSSKLNERYEAELSFLAMLTPNTAAYAEQLARVKDLEAARLDLAGGDGKGFANMYDQMGYSLINFVEAQSVAIAEAEKAKVLEENMMNLSLMTNLASDSFMLFFETIGQSGNYFGNVTKGFARLIAGIGKQKVAFNIAEGTEALARSFGWISLGNFASAAAAKTAAVGHFKSAALWGAVAGGAGAVSGGSSSGGGAGGSAGASTSSRDRDFGDLSGQANIYIQGGLLDMSNPEQARSLAIAMQQLSGRRVNVVGA